MKIYDCFSYWDEDLLLDLRLNALNNFIDYFVIVEGNKTWQNRSEEHTSELQSRRNLVCRLLLEKKKNNITIYYFSLIY